MVYKSGNCNTPRKDLEPQVKLQHPFLNNMASDNRKEEVVDSFAPLVTPLSEKALLGFSTPPTDKKKSRER